MANNKISETIGDAALSVYRLQGDDLEDGVDKKEGDEMEKKLIEITDQILRVMGETPVEKGDNGVLDKVAELDVLEPKFVEKLINENEELSKLLEGLVKMKNEVDDIFYKEFNK